MLHSKTAYDSHSRGFKKFDSAATTGSFVTWQRVLIFETRNSSLDWEFWNLSTLVWLSWGEISQKLKMWHRARTHTHTYRRFNTGFSFWLKVQRFPLEDKNRFDGLVHTVTSPASDGRFCLTEADIALFRVAQGQPASLCCQGPFSLCEHFRDTRETWKVSIAHTQTQGCSPLTAKINHNSQFRTTSKHCMRTYTSARPVTHTHALLLLIVWRTEG